MPSIHSLFLARCVFAPATLMWCTMMMDNPRVFRAWARGGVVKVVEIPVRRAPGR
jgi:hypothetical protein